MKNEIVDSLIRVITGISGGGAALWLFWADKDEKGENKIISKERAIGFLILGICGSYFIAPAINEHFELKEGMASSVSFLSAVFADALLMFVWKLLKSLSTKVSAIADKLIDRYGGK